MHRSSGSFQVLPGSSCPVEAAMPGGGFIRCAAHNTWRDAPLSKVVVLSEAYHECGAYRDR